MTQTRLSKATGCSLPAETPAERPGILKTLTRDVDTRRLRRPADV
jgi:hypothetical protein